MRIHNLSTNPNFPCSLINVNNVTVMLDCALDVSTLSLFAPLDVIPSQQCQSDTFSIKNVQKDFLDVFSVKYINTTPEFIIPNIELLDMSMIDVVLISNFNYILGLPYITEHPDFRGVVYATEPTTQFGKLLMEEYTKPLEKVNRPRSLKSLFSKSSQISELAGLRRTALATNNNNSSNNPATTITNSISNNNKEFPSLRRWRKMYSSSDVLSCLRKMEVIAYNEAKEIPGGLILQAFSSGFCIGSCNWTISSPYHKIGYISASSTFPNHAKPLDLAPLTSCDIMVVGGLKVKPDYKPEFSINSFCHHAGVTLKEGGNVLVPCSAIGHIFDLIESLFQNLDSLLMTSLHVYIISPVAKNSLAYANIYAEWLSKSKQSKVYQPESPFSHAELIRSNRLHTYASLSEGFCKEVRHPCVVFACDSSLRFGDVVRLVHTWRGARKNSIMFLDPNVDHLEALMPFNPVNMTVCSLPLITNLNVSEASKILADLKPAKIIINDPNLVASSSSSSSPDKDLFIEKDLNPLPLSPDAVIRISLKVDRSPVIVKGRLAAKLRPVRTSQRKSAVVAYLSGVLTRGDGKYVIDLPPTKKSVQNSVASVCTATTAAAAAAAATTTAAISDNNGNIYDNKDDDDGYVRSFSTFGTVRDLKSLVEMLQEHFKETPCVLMTKSCVKIILNNPVVSMKLYDDHCDIQCKKITNTSDVKKIMMTFLEMCV